MRAFAFPNPPAIPIPPALERVLDSKQPGYYDGQNNNTHIEFIDWNANDDFVYRDIVYGDGGYDYISTGGGDDKIVLGSNWGAWRGSGNEFGNAAIADGGSGNDDIYVRGSEGAFNIYIGEGQDDVYVTGATKLDDYVKINAHDIDGARDRFFFGEQFNGDAEIFGIDSWDRVSLEGGDWGLASTANGNMLYTNSTGGSVTLMGILPGVYQPDVVFL